MGHKLLPGLAGIGAGLGMIVLGYSLNEESATSDFTFYLRILGFILVSAVAVFLFVGRARQYTADLPRGREAPGESARRSTVSIPRRPAVRATSGPPSALLHHAATDGHLENVKALLDRGAEVNVAPSKPAHHPETVAAANLEVAPSPGMAGPHQAAVAEPPMLGASVDVHEAVAQGDLETVNALLKDNPALVAGKNESGLTPLHLAAGKGHKEVAEFLLASEAEVNAKDNNGWTALHWAAIYGRKEVVALLLAHNAQVNARENNGWTPLHWAAGKGREDVAALLRQHGGND